MASETASAGAIHARVCAWCGRISLGRFRNGDDHAWAPATAVAGARATHGVCSSCLTELARSGKRPLGQAH